MRIATGAPINEVLEAIRHRDHATAGFTTALAGAAAAALGQAVMGISLDPASAPAAAHARLGEIVQALAALADEDAGALSQLLAAREAGDESQAWAALLRAPAEMSSLMCEAAERLQAFRPQVVEPVRDDMEFAIVLLAAAARSALLIVESNLRQWRSPDLHARFGPETERLAQRVAALSPIERIAWR